MFQSIWKISRFWHAYFTSWLLRYFAYDINTPFNRPTKLIIRSLSIGFRSDEEVYPVSPTKLIFEIAISGYAISKVLIFKPHETNNSHCCLHDQNKGGGNVFISKASFSLVLLTSSMQWAKCNTIIFRFIYKLKN